MNDSGDTPHDSANPVMKRLPLIAVAVVALT